jgi:single-strand DNA-binding protein
MSSLENHVIVGNVGSAPETNVAGSSTVCKFRVAVNRTYKSTETTTWYTVEAWGRLGEICQEYVNVGSLVGVVGDRLSVYAFINKDNEPQASLQITARDVQFLSAKKDSVEEESGADAGDIPW